MLTKFCDYLTYFGSIAFLVANGAVSGWLSWFYLGAASLLFWIWWKLYKVEPSN